MKRKIISFLLLAAMLLTLAACGTSPDPVETQQPSQEPEQTEPPVNTPDVTEVSTLPITEEPTYVSLYCTMEAGSMAYIDGLSDVLAYQKSFELTNVYLETTTITSTAAKESYNIMFNSGEYCDILARVSMYYSGGLASALSDGIIIDVKDLIYEYCPNYLGYMEELDCVKAQTLDTGEIAGFTTLGDGAASAMTDIGMGLRSDWLQELGMEVPETYDELHDVLSAFKNKYGAVLYLNNTGSDNRNFITAGYDAFITSAAGQSGGWSVVDGKVRFDWIEDSTRAYYSMMNKWHEEGLVWEDFVTGKAGWLSNNKASLELLLDGKIGVGLMSLSDLDNLPANALPGQEGMTLAAMPIPTQTRGQEIKAIKRDPTGSGNAVWCISGDCPEEKYEIICKYVDFWYSDTGIELGNWGVEGVTFNKDANGEYSFTDLIVNDPDERSMNTMIALHLLDGTPYYSLGARTLAAYTDQQLENGYLWRRNVTAEYGYWNCYTMTPDESSEYSKVFGDISTYYTEMAVKFIVGDEDVDNDEVWNTYLATMKEMGYEACRDIKQAAYDRFQKK